MKNLTKNMMIAAAALVVAAGTAQAQQLKAEIPFSFRASGTLMPAGEYRVEGMRGQSSTSLFKLTNVDSHQAILAVPYVSGSSAEGNATLSFECGGAHCALVQMIPGNGTAYRFSRPKMDKGEDTHVALIRAVLMTR